jgi:hypothetical protein
MIRRERFNFGMNDDYRCVLNQQNRYRQDREFMKSSSYSGLGHNFQAQDLCITETMGELQDRAKEHLVPSDAPLVIARKVLSKAIRDVQEGRSAPQMELDSRLQRRRRIVSLYGTVPSSVNWKQYCKELEFADGRERILEPGRSVALAKTSVN